MNEQDIHKTVREGYAAIAQQPAKSGGCCGASSSKALATSVGYSAAELALIPEEANLGLSCGNPTAIAALQPGEVVVDLGSGAGMDAFLAAAQVGETGRVIGVDMTPEMLQRARKTAASRDVAHFVEFREGMIEELPVVSSSVDCVLSNCVVNLSPDKGRVFREAFRVLKPGGRLAVSDLCLEHALPANVLAMAEAYVGCISGAALATDYLAAIEQAGFVDVKWTRASADSVVGAGCCDTNVEAAIASLDASDLEAVQGAIWSYKIEARKP